MVPTRAACRTVRPRFLSAGHDIQGFDFRPPFRPTPEGSESRLHLPSEEELLRGMAFFGDRLEDDIREYGSRLSRRMKKRGRVELLPLANCLDDLATEQSEDGIRSVEAALGIAEAVKGFPPVSHHSQAPRVATHFRRGSRDGGVSHFNTISDW